MSIVLLDCTLRDGGHVNNASFGANTIKEIIDGLVKAKLDYVELGFLKNGRFTPDQSSYNDSVQILPYLPPRQQETAFTVMIRPDWYDIRQLSQATEQIHAIRFAFYYRDIELLKEQISIAEKLGYHYFCNPVNIMGYNDQKLCDLVKQINDLHPEQMTMVDTYGAMRLGDLHRIYSIIEDKLDSSIRIGLHLHENQSLAFGLAQEFIRLHNPNRDIALDASLLGMGRIPGNLCTEIISDYLNNVCNSGYNTDVLYQLIGNYIEPIKHMIPWGYSPAYFITACLHMHRSYAEFLLNKPELKLCDINKILKSIHEDMRDEYHADYIEKLYQKYISER